MHRIALFLLGLLAAHSVWADPITYPHSWSGDEVLFATDLNANFAAAGAAVNGNLDANNLKSTAGIRGGQLSDAPNGITANKLNTAAVTEPKLADLAVGNAKLGANAVTSDKILDGGVNAVDLAADAVGSSQIQDAGVLTIDVADGAVTSQKIAVGGVESGNLLGDAVTPDAVLTAGQTDGYCLAYLAAGDTWTWRPCDEAPALFINGAGLTNADGLDFRDTASFGFLKTPGASGSPDVLSVYIKSSSISRIELQDESVTAPKFAVGANPGIERVTYCENASETVAGGTSAIICTIPPFTTQGGSIEVTATCMAKLLAGEYGQLSARLDGALLQLVTASFPTGNAGTLIIPMTTTYAAPFHGSLGQSHTFDLYAAAPVSAVDFDDCRLNVVVFRN